jgi:hypothetical protein
MTMTHENATCWVVAWVVATRTPSASDAPLDRGKLTTVQVDTSTLC